MSRQTTTFNAFTGMSPLEKKAIVDFLCTHTNTNCKDVQEALDYALKRKPSFGGFVMATMERQRVIAAIVVNRTGMEGYNPGNICVYIAIDKQCEQPEEVLQELMSKAINHAQGNLAMHVEPDNPALQLYQQMGFRAKYLELRLDKERAIA